MLDLLAGRVLCGKALAYRLNEWHDEMMQTMPFGYDNDPLWTVIREGGPEHARGHLAEYVKRLEATGRAFGVEELKKRHPYEFKQGYHWQGQRR